MSENENGKMTIQKMKPTRLVYDKGMNDLDEPIWKDGKTLKFYKTWQGMLSRCYSEESLSKHRTYVGCSVCSSWLSLSNFKVWFDVNYREGMALDKDILIQGNKIYSPEACRFVPEYINNLLTDAGAARGAYPLGVTAVKSKAKNGRITTTYQAACRGGNGKKCYKNFRTIPEAAAWYSLKKKEVVGQQAIHAFMAGDITEDVYQALIARGW